MVEVSNSREICQPDDGGENSSNSSAEICDGMRGEEETAALHVALPPAPPARALVRASPWQPTARERLRTAGHATCETLAKAVSSSLMPRQDGQPTHENEEEGWKMRSKQWYRYRMRKMERRRRMGSEQKGNGTERREKSRLVGRACHESIERISGPLLAFHAALVEVVLVPVLVPRPGLVHAPALAPPTSDSAPGASLHLSEFPAMALGWHTWLFEGTHPMKDLGRWLWIAMKRDFFSVCTFSPTLIAVLYR
eukprot:447030-Hanusia_phi.AAC.8